MPKLERKFIDTLIKYRHILFFFVITVLAWMARKGGMDYFSPDMNLFLMPWYEEIQQAGGLRGLSQGVGDYNVLYQTLIALFSYIPLGGTSPMYLYKAVSILCDYLLALACGWIVARERGEKLLERSFCLTYGVVLMIPTVILNSSVWGQCDSMYTLACVLSLYWLYKEKYLPSFVMLGIAFGLKLQTVFILPVFLYFYISRRSFSLGWFLVTVAAFWATGIPAYLAGRPLTTVFDIYIYQTGEYPQMIQNALSVWYFFFPNYTYMKPCAVMLTVSIFGAFLYWLLNGGGKLKETPESFFVVCAWSAWTCLLFLPAMHDRYGYLMDALLVLLCCLDRKYLKYAAVQILGSGVVYMGYLYVYKWPDIPNASPIAAAIASAVSLGMWLHFTFTVLAGCREPLPENAGVA